MSDASQDLTPASEVSSSAQADLQIPAEVLREMPSEVRETILSIGMMRGVSHNSHPLLEKLTPEHISQLLADSDKENQRQFQSTIFTQKLGVFYAILAVSLLVFLFVFLKSDRELLQLIFQYFAAVLAGFGGGYAYKSHRTKENS